MQVFPNRPMSSFIIRGRPISTTLGPESPNFDPTSAMLGRNWARSGQARPDFDQTWPNVTRIRPRLARRRPDFARDRPKLPHRRPNSVQAGSAKAVPRSTNLGPNSTAFRQHLAQTRPRLAGVGPILADEGEDRDVFLPNELSGSIHHFVGYILAASFTLSLVCSWSAFAGLRRRRSSCFTSATSVRQGAEPSVFTLQPCTPGVSLRPLRLQPSRVVQSTRW